MKKYLTVMLAALLCLSSCSAKAIPQPTFEELMADVNEKHKGVVQSDFDYSPYLKKEDLERSPLYYHNQAYEGYDPAIILTQEQAEEDVTYLFEALHTCYGPYEFFGGEEVFDAAEEKIKAGLSEFETISSQELTQLMVANLGFVEDSHFKIHQSYVGLFKMPFFFREVSFVKTDDGYRTTNGKKVKSIDGHELDEIMKLSISSEGKLVYYPVLLKDCDYIEASETPQICDETLTVNYSNGDKQELTAENFQVFNEQKAEEPTSYTRYHGDIPVFQFNRFTEDYEGIISGATLLKESPVSILDLRSNRGGVCFSREWMEEYTDDKVTENCITIKSWEGSVISNKNEKWTENDNTLIILTGKSSASASEILIDHAYNVENILFVGENTFGAMRSDSYYTYLPNSGCPVSVGRGSLHIFPEGDYFEEFRGYYPDIWVPAAEAEELVIKMLEQIER